MLHSCRSAHACATTAAECMAHNIFAWRTHAWSRQPLRHVSCSSLTGVSRLAIGTRRSACSSHGEAVLDQLRCWDSTTDDVRPALGRTAHVQCHSIWQQSVTQTPFD